MWITGLIYYLLINNIFAYNSVVITKFNMVINKSTGPTTTITIKIFIYLYYYVQISVNK